jgi:hypothetical protein
VDPARVTDFKPAYSELLTHQGAAEKFARQTRSERKSLSLVLEELDPSDAYPDTGPYSHLGRLDAFERQMLAFNLRTKPDLRLMQPASTLQEFMDPVKPDGKRFFASDQPQSWVLYPEFINRQMRIIPLPDDVLGALVAQVTPVDTDLYKTIYLNDNIQTAPGQAQRQLQRVGEGAEIPAITISTFENGVQLNKYGIALKGTYETYRRLRVDLFTLFLARIAMQIKLDLATWAINVVQNGDGNSNAAPNYNVSTLDAAAPAGPGAVTDFVTGQSSTITKGLTYRSWLLLRATLYPLHMTTVVGRLNELLQVLTLQFPNIDPLTMLALLQQPDQRVQTGRLSMRVSIFNQDVELVYHPWAPGGVLIGLDKRFAVEQLVENNSALTETDKDIRSQLNEIVVSQVVGFDKFLTLASSQLTFV